MKPGALARHHKHPCLSLDQCGHQEVAGLQRVADAGLHAREAKSRAVRLRTRLQRLRIRAGRLLQRRGENEIPGHHLVQQLALAVVAEALEGHRPEQQGLKQGKRGQRAPLLLEHQAQLGQSQPRAAVVGPDAGAQQTGAGE